MAKPSADRQGGVHDEPVVVLDSVTKTYRIGAVEVRAVRGVSLAIAPQRFTMLIGPSGSGKTTLLNLIGCIDASTTGTVRIAGQNVAELSDNALSDFRARRVGFIFQGFSLIPVLTAYENVEYPLLLMGVPAQKRREATLEMLEAVGLKDQHRQRPNELSGGQKQRVAIARALVKRPDIVLADEPTANLDFRDGCEHHSADAPDADGVAHDLHLRLARFASDLSCRRYVHDPRWRHRRRGARGMIFKIAFRSIFRNTRRSLTTMLTIAIGTAATLVFGAYTVYVTYGLQTSTVDRVGHLTVYRRGYFDFGTGNPAIWGIPHYNAVLKMIATDPVLQPLIAVATPVQSLAGIASNSESGELRTFVGTGFIPSDRDAMRRWDEYRVGRGGDPDTGLRDGDKSQGIVGVGMARVLGLCEKLHLGDCPKLPTGAPSENAASADVAGLPKQDFSDLAARDQPAAARHGPPAPRIDLLAATAGGAPNVVDLEVIHADPQGVRDLDDIYVGMHLVLAQELVYGRGEHRATGIVIQLHRTEDMPLARERLAALFKTHGLDLETRDFAEITPFYTQALNLFRSIFSFISVIIGIVVIFTVSNAMGMSVVERTDEIGTTRALGLRRAGIRRQFLIEGVLLGVMGATAGVLIAFIVSCLVNQGGLTWLPPGQAQPVPLKLYMFGAWDLVGWTWALLIGLAAVAALLPANRAARLQIVDALRHV